MIVNDVSEINKADLAVLRALHLQDYAQSAGEIYFALRSSGTRIGLTTVYRTLTALVQAGTAHAFERNSETAYRLCEDFHHRHLVCRACGLIVDARELDLDGMLHTVPLAAGFHVEAIYGTCVTCRADSACRD